MQEGKQEATKVILSKKSGNVKCIFLEIGFDSSRESCLDHTVFQK